MNPLKQKQLDSLLSALESEEEYVFFDTARSDAVNRYSYLFVQPLERLDFRVGDDLSQFVSKMEETLAAGFYLAGWMSYEFGYLLESRLADLLTQDLLDKKTILASFGVFERPFFYDHKSGVTDFPIAVATEELSDFTVNDIRFSQNRESYLRAISKIKEYITVGDTYQVNYTLKLLFDFSGSPEAFYRNLRRNQSVAYGAMIHLAEEHILSLSPELFFKIDTDRILVRPMKGTMKRGRDWEEDQQQGELLRQDDKNRSENVMIVDLLRNDLARLCRQLGDTAVVTESLFDVERFESVLQMTSTVSAVTDGRVLSRVPILDVLKALFPCGSVTGAPKIRTMEIIRELELAPRGVYTGAAGYLAPDGTGIFNVPIRTVRLNGNSGEMGIGSGIVHDSVPEQEWQECLLKADFLTKSIPEFVLLETLLRNPQNEYYLLDYHLDRLRKSACYFSFNFSADTILNALDCVEPAEHRASDYQLVRLTLAKDGEVEITTRVCGAPQRQVLPQSPPASHDGLPAVALSPYKVDSSLVWFYHKTTERALFSREFERAGEQALFDLIFQHERSEITEGCITNLIVYIGSTYYTPPVSSGLLAGTMRAEILSKPFPEVQEKILSLEDIRRAKALFCCNSVRGIVQVRLVEP